MVSRIPYRSFKDRSALLIVGPALVVLAVAIVALKSPVVGAALAAALEDRDWQVRQAAEDVTPVAEI